MEDTVDLQTSTLTCRFKINPCFSLMSLLRQLLQLILCKALGKIPRTVGHRTLLLSQLTEKEELIRKAPLKLPQKCFLYSLLLTQECRCILFCEGVISLQLPSPPSKKAPTIPQTSTGA